MVDSVRVLVIDDSDDDRENYIHLLKSDPKSKYIFLEAASGEEGLALYQSFDVHCVLLDYAMPGYNGIEALCDLVTVDRHVPVVMLTGQGNEELAAQAIKLGAQDYLTKNSVTAEALKRVVHNTIGRVQMLRMLDEQQDDLVTFANVLAHDLKAPINVICGMNALVLEALENQDYSEIEMFSQRIERSARRMSELIDTLKVYNKSFEKLAKSVPAPLDGIVDDVLTILEMDIKQCGAIITHDPLPIVLCDPPQILQLIQNLIANAIKFCAADTTPRVHISAEELPDGNWKMAVKDNGIGIESEHVKSVFEPFKRLHSSETYSGSGLGLATCKKIMDRHRSKIWCSSEPGDGTVFFFTLPKVRDDRDDQ